MQLFVKSEVANTNAGMLSLRCPACKQIGTFSCIGTDLAFADTLHSFTVGHRVCPNPACRAHVFVAFKNRRLSASYPPERIDFDSTNIPQTIINSFEEAITCHAHQCFIASASMVRKTLELLCAEQHATGQNLKERIKSLGSQVVLPPDLLNGLDDLRLLGNDAAHVESQEYSKVSKEELDVAIEFTKEVLKAIYQYSALLTKLKNLKKLPPSQNA